MDPKRVAHFLDSIKGWMTGVPTSALLFLGSRFTPVVRKMQTTMKLLNISIVLVFVKGAGDHGRLVSGVAQEGLEIGWLDL